MCDEVDERVLAVEAIAPKRRDNWDNYLKRSQLGDYQHDREPGCAVREAIQEGMLEGERF